MNTFRFTYNNTNFVYVEECKYIEDNCPYKNAVEIATAFSDGRLLNEILAVSHCGTIMQIPQKPENYEITLQGDTFVVSNMETEEADVTVPDNSNAVEIQQPIVEETKAVAEEQANMTFPVEKAMVSEKAVPEVSLPQKSTDGCMLFGEPLPSDGLFEFHSTVYASTDDILQVQLLSREVQEKIVNKILEDLPDYEFKKFPRIEELVTKAYDSGFKQGSSTANEYKELWLKAKGELENSSSFEKCVDAEESDDLSESVEQSADVKTMMQENVSEPETNTTTRVSELAEQYGVPRILLESCKAYTVKPMSFDSIKESDDLKRDLYNQAEEEHWAYYDGWYAVDVVTDYYRLFVNFDTSTVVSIPVADIQNVIQE